MPVKIGNRYQSRLSEQYSHLPLLNVHGEGTELKFLLILHGLLFCYLSNMNWMSTELL